jgi:type VI secretion system protein ImpC
VEQTVGASGGIPWAFAGANYFFNLAATDHKLVERVSEIAREAGAPFVAGATADLVGCESLAMTPDPDDWQLPVGSEIEHSWARVTALDSANYVGFALPRFLLRLPYGKETEPTEEFEFEEFVEDVENFVRHESYLWGNPVFAVACLLARGFSEEGWTFRPSDRLEIADLPLHVYKHNGESETKPCAEVLLTVRAAEKIINRGLIPLLSMKDSDVIRVGMFQSIRGTALHGRWNR